MAGSNKPRKINRVWLIISGIMFLAAISGGLFGNKIGAIYAKTLGDPKVTMNDFLESFIAGDYSKAVEYLENCNLIKIEKFGSDLSRELSEKLIKSYNLKLISCTQKGVRAIAEVELERLDIKSLLADISKNLNSSLEAIIAEYPTSTVYVEENEYTDNFKRIAVETVAYNLMKDNDYISSRNITFELDYTNGEWRIIQNTDFNSGISGDVLKEFQTSNAINISNRLSAELNRQLKELRNELAVLTRIPSPTPSHTPTPTPSPTNTPTPTPTNTPTITPKVHITPTIPPLRKSTAEYVVDEYAVSGPAPNQACFGKTNDPQVIMQLLQTETAKKLIGDQKVIFDPDVKFYTEKPIAYYLDETILALSWTKLSDKYHDLECMAEVFIADGSQFRRKLSGDAFIGKTFNHKEAGEKQGVKTPDKLAQEANAVLAINADYYAWRSSGIVVYQGQIYRANLNDGFETCFVRSDGQMLFTRSGFFKSKAELQKYIEDNDIMFSVCFGPILVEANRVIEHSKYPIGSVSGNYARGGFGMMGDKHYVIMMTTYIPRFADPKSPYGWCYPTNVLAQRMAALGVERAYAVDGGQSLAIIVNGEQMAYEIYSVRSMSDIIYFSTAIPSE